MSGGPVIPALLFAPRASQGHGADHPEGRGPALARATGRRGPALARATGRTGPGCKPGPRGRSSRGPRGRTGPGCKPGPRGRSSRGPRAGACQGHGLQARGSQGHGPARGRRLPGPRGRVRAASQGHGPIIPRATGCKPGEARATGPGRSSWATGRTGCKPGPRVRYPQETHIPYHLTFSARFSPILSGCQFDRLTRGQNQCILNNEGSKHMVIPIAFFVTVVVFAWVQTQVLAPRQPY